MATKELKFTHTSDMFGTKIRLQSDDKSFNEQIVNSTQLDTNPFDNSNPSLTGGFMFHSPDMSAEGWEQTFNALTSFDGEFSIKTELNEGSEKISSVLRVADKMDAATVAWSTINTWEKWSEEQETESKIEKKPEIFTDEHGNIKARITVETLSDN